MTDNLEMAKSHKNGARTNITLASKLSDTTLYEEALEELEIARDYLFKEQKLLNISASKHKMAMESRLQTVGFELADCYGISGGVYRKMGKIREAIEMYDNGYIYEADPLYRIQNSYNLVNGIVLKVLSGTRSPLEVSDNVIAAIITVQKQVESTRNRDWWAWADLGLLRLLNRDFDLAMDAYRKIKELGPGDSNVSSMTAVLAGLQEKLSNQEPEIATAVAKAAEFLKIR